MKQLMDHIKACWNYIVAGWGFFAAWVVNHLPEVVPGIIALEKALIDHLRFLTVAGSLALVVFQLRQVAARKRREADDKS